jgi:pimeloyl-ACP methyl ester carboxylesterase
VITESYACLEGYRIWYRVARSSTSDSRSPILLLHGGPGLGSDYLEPLELLAEQGRTVIRFDQLGSGRSDRPRDLSLWRIEGCIRQIESIREALGLDRFHLLGHSWGGMVALEYLLTQPSVVVSACLCSSVVSVQLWADEGHRLRRQMPKYLSEALDRCARSYPPAEQPQPGARPLPSWNQRKINRCAQLLRLGYLFISNLCAAWIASWMSYCHCLIGLASLPLNIQFIKRHDCRLKTIPFAMFKTLAGSNDEIHNTLIGQSEFYPTGILKDWDIRPSLSQICCPTLILSGRYDEATPPQMEILRDKIAGSKQKIFENSSHCGWLEEPDDYRKAILDFVNEVEPADAY